MSEINIFSLKRIFIISLILSIFTLAIISQAGIGDSGDLEDTTTTTTTTTTQYPDFGGTNLTATEPTRQPGTAQDIGYQKTEEAEALDQGGLDIGSEDFSSAKNIFLLFLNTGVKFIATTLIFVTLICMNYILIYNNEEVREYLNRSLQLAGFIPIVKSLGKSWEFNPGCTMKLSGFINPKISFMLVNIGNPYDYGLRILGEQVSTTCSLEMLPSKLQVIRMYLDGY